jgi:uncharacterized protein
MSAASRVVHVMSKPTGAIFNLDCEYCFFLSKEELYPGSGFPMPEDVHEAYIREPTLMGIEFYRRTLELEQR